MSRQTELPPPIVPPPEPKPAWRKLIDRLWAAPDPNLVHAGLRGEWLIAGIRLLIVLLVLYLPLREHLLVHRQGGGDMLVLWVATLALLEALVIYSAVRRSWGREWIGFFSGVLDVSFVTLALWIFLTLDRPLVALQDQLIFPVYFLAIGATSLRYDFRISLLVGVSAIVQYAGLVYYAVWQWDLDDPSLQPLAADFSWYPHLGRLVLLGMATLLATTLIRRAHEQRTLSNRDRLTDLANRGFFDESMDRIAALASRSGEPVAVAMIDVDHFKKFNDTYGHQSGDVALQVVAGTLAQSFRNTDLVARYGGEEFAGLFPGMSLEDAATRLESLRARIERRAIRLDSGKVARVTISIGVAVWPSDGAQLGDALALADLRLYQAKHAGRNRIVTTADSGLQTFPSEHAAARRG